ncbi:MAG: biosynthetic-type acetolactate synthase large subunit [Clostridia bacterium]|jgi:acetolactate synthase-1/2/3 large subunit|nr:biosynthetic-type acetolactate synthase large subunit [Clostridia bacterium]MDD4572028.1 biosynthetic-type acetolactate synthase large subunit [Clostridia bacterium]
MKGSEALIKCLEYEGVKTVFGYPGGTVLGLYEALRHSSIHNVLTRTEQGAAHAASGYARIAGMPGVCIATSGPGATNLVTGIATAFMDSIPMVAITGQVPKSIVGTDAFQEVDITGITKPITKHNYLVTEANQIPQIVREAFHIASTGRPGPVLIDLPKDVADSECTAKIPGQIDLPGYKPTIKGHPSQIKLACKILNQSKKPVIYVGGGIVHSGAEALLLELSERLDAPVAVTLMGKGAFPYKNNLYMGMVGIHGCPAANIAVCNCDVLLAIGARFDDRVTSNMPDFASNAQIIHIDVDPAEIGKNIIPKVPIVGDAASIIKDMLKCLNQASHPEWLAQVEAWRPTEQGVYYEGKDDEALTMRKVLHQLSEMTRDNVIVTTDVGQHQMVAAQFYKARRAKGFISSGGLGTMGYGLPAAVGAQLASPESIVFCVTGDGSFQMTFNELATASAENLPIKVLLFNNNNLGMVRQLQKFYMKENYYSVDMPGNPDFIKLAQAYGMETYTMEHTGQIQEILAEAMDNNKATLIECKVSCEEMVYPVVLCGRSIDEMILFKGDK